MAQLADELWREVLVQLGSAAPTASVGAAAAVCRRWRVLAADSQVWGAVYSRIFRTSAAAELVWTGAKDAPQESPINWRAVCQQRCMDSSLAHDVDLLHHSFATPPPLVPGGRRPIQARPLAGSLDPLSGSHDRALASPQTRRIASYVYARPGVVGSIFEQAMAAFVGGDAGGESACMIAPAERVLQPLRGLYARTGRRICYFEARFRGGGSMGVVGEGVWRGSAHNQACGRAHVGWQFPSVGFHSDDGLAYIALAEPTVQELEGGHFRVPYRPVPCGRPYGAAVVVSPPSAAADLVSSEEDDDDDGAHHSIASSEQNELVVEAQDGAWCGDVVGCAVDMDQRTVSFFLRGERVQGEPIILAPEVQVERLFPAVALHQHGDEVDISLGFGGFLCLDAEAYFLRCGVEGEGGTVRLRQ